MTRADLEPRRTQAMLVCQGGPRRTQEEQEPRRSQEEEAGELFVTQAEGPRLQASPDPPWGSQGSPRLLLAFQAGGPRSPGGASGATVEPQMTQARPEGPRPSLAPQAGGGPRRSQGKPGGGRGAPPHEIWIRASGYPGRRPHFPT